MGNRYWSLIVGGLVSCVEFGSWMGRRRVDEGFETHRALKEPPGFRDVYHPPHPKLRVFCENCRPVRIN